jgi:hypothetical protein
MFTRTSRVDVVFRRPFIVKGVEGLQPAGTYTVETEEQLLDGLSFPAYRRIWTVITVRANDLGTLMQGIPIDPRDLAAAQVADAQDTTDV